MYICITTNTPHDHVAITLRTVSIIWPRFQPSWHTRFSKTYLWCEHWSLSKLLLLLLIGSGRSGMLRVAHIYCPRVCAPLCTVEACLCLQWGGRVNWNNERRTSGNFTFYLQPFPFRKWRAEVDWERAGAKWPRLLVPVCRTRWKVMKMNTLFPRKNSDP